MKFAKKVIGVTLSVAMLASQVMPVMASDTDPASTTGGEGNLLAYSKTQVVVPTTLKLALNPSGYNINIRYNKVAADATFDSDTTYYTESDGEYEVANITAFASNTVYYTADQSNSQVVSLNYGIANKSTSDKKIGISFAVTKTAGTGENEIEFVDSADKTTTDVTRDDYNMYLAAASSKTLPTAVTHRKIKSSDLDSDGKFKSDTDYYTFAAATGYTAVDTSSVDTPAANTVYYVDDTAIGPDIIGSELADVTVGNNGISATGNVAFAKPNEGTNVAEAEIAYLLDPGDYKPMDGKKLDFNTTSEDLADILELKAIGGVAAFTLTGAINDKADWTKVDSTALTITPTYDVSDSTGDEEFIGEAKNTDPYNQIKTVPASVGPSIATTSYTMTAGQALEISYSLGLGDAAATGVSSVMVSNFPGVELYTNTDFVTQNVAANKFSLTATAIDAIIGQEGDSATLTVKFDNDDVVEVTLNDPA